VERYRKKELKKNVLGIYGMKDGNVCFEEGKYLVCFLLCLFPFVGNYILFYFNIENVALYFGFFCFCK
jgi:hypothetical protein